jgi:hypothetical protein
MSWKRELYRPRRLAGPQPVIQLPTTPWKRVVYGLGSLIAILLALYALWLLFWLVIYALSGGEVTSLAAVR